MDLFTASGRSLGSRSKWWIDNPDRPGSLGPKDYSLDASHQEDVRPLVRGILLVVSVSAVIAMGAHFESARGDHWPYPTPADLSADYSAHVDEQVLLWVQIEQIHEGARSAQVRVPGTSLSLTVHGFDAPVEPGGTVQVYGTLRPDHVVAADTVAVVNPTAGSKRYKYVVSVLGAVLFLALFFRHWRVNPETFSLEAR